MVTLTEARAQVQQTRKQFEQKRQQVQKAKPKELTTRQVRSQTATDVAKRKAERMGFTSRRQEALKQLGSFETQLKEQESIVSQAEQQQRTVTAQAGKLERDIAMAKKFISSGRRDLETFSIQARNFGLTKDQKNIASNLLEAQTNLTKFKTKSAAIKEELDISNVQFKEVLPEQLASISLPALQRLEKAGAVEFGETKQTGGIQDGSAIQFRLSDGITNRDDLLQSNRNVIDSSSGDFFSGFKKGFKKEEKEETFISGVGFVSPSPGVPEVSKSTLTIRQPTIEEKKQLNLISDRNVIDSSSGDFFSGFKKGFKKEEKEETFISGVGFVSPSPGVPEVSKSTLTIRQPTIEEKKQLDLISDRKIIPVPTIGITGIDFKTISPKDIFGERKSENILTADLGAIGGRTRAIEKSLQNLEDTTSKVNTLQEELQKIADKKIDPNTNEWVGTLAELKVYKDKIKKFEKQSSKANINIQKLESLGATITDDQIKFPTIKSGLFGLTRDTSTRKFDFQDKPITTLGKVLSTTAGSVTGKGTEKGLNILGFKPQTIPERQTQILVPKRETIQKNILTGETVSSFQDVTIPSQVITSEKIGKVVGTGTEVGVDIGKFFLPGGGVLFGTEIQEEFGEDLLKPIEFVKKRPLEAAGLALFGGLALKTKVLPKLRKLILKETQIFLKGSKTPILISKPSRVIQRGEERITIFEKISQVSKVPQRTGRKVVLTTPSKEFFGKRIRVSKEGVQILPSERAIFKGSARLDPEGRKKAIKILTEQAGFTKAKAEKLLRESRPKIVEDRFGGRAVVIESEEGQIINLFGELKSKPIVKQLKDIKTAGGRSEIKIIDVKGKPVKIIKDDIEIAEFGSVLEKALLTKQGKPFTKISQRGKLTERTESIIGSKKIDEVELPVANLGRGVEEVKVFDIFKQVERRKQTIPKKRGIEREKDIVLVEQGKPDVIIDLDEILGVQKVRGFMGGGKKSSPEFLQQMFAPQETKEKLASVLLKKLKPKSVPKIKTTSQTIQTSTSSLIGIPRATGGAGLTDLQLAQARGKPIPIEEMEIIETGTTTFNPIISQTRIDTITIGDVKVKVKPSVATFQQPQLKGLQQELLTKDLTKLSPISLNLLRTGLESKLTLKELTKIKQLPLTKLTQVQQFQQVQQVQQVQRNSRREKQKQLQRTIPTQKTPLPKIIIPPGVSETATLKKLVAIAKKKQGVDVVVGLKLKKRKVIARNLPPFKALKKAQKYVDRNIEASYLLKPSKKKAKGRDIKPFNINKKFRPSKTNPLFVVEKRKFRLDSPGEKKQIKKTKKGKKLQRRLLGFK